MEQEVRRTALVTGATGAIGPSAVRAFLAAGYAVRVLALDPPSPGTLPDEVSLTIGDVSDPATVRSVVDGVGFVVHLAALLHAFHQTRHTNERYRQINVGGTANVVESAARAGVKRVVFFSTIAVYGHSGQGILTEDSTPHPGTAYAQTKLDAERLVLDARRSDGQALGTVLRLAAVYGPRVKGNYWRLVRSLAYRRFIPIGNGRNRRTLVYDQDVARAALLAARHPVAAGRIYNVTDGLYHTMEEIVRAICDALGRRPPRMKMPVGPARWAAGMLEDVAAFVHLRSPVGRATIDKYAEDLAVSGERIQKELGFEPEYDLTRGWKEAVCEMHCSGEL